MAESFQNRSELLYMYSLSLTVALFVKHKPGKKLNEYLE
jgi:hypothetical protein